MISARLVSGTTLENADRDSVERLAVTCSGKNESSIYEADNSNENSNASPGMLATSIELDTIFT